MKGKFALYRNKRTGRVIRVPEGSRDQKSAEASPDWQRAEAPRAAQQVDVLKQREKSGA